MKLAGLFFRNGHVGSLDRYLGTKFSGLLSWVGWFAAEWSNYSDLTQPGPPKEVAEKGKWDPLFQGNLGWWTINWMNLCVSVGLSDVAGVTKNIWGQPWLEMPGHGTMARWETSVLESQNQLYPDCFFYRCKQLVIDGFQIQEKQHHTLSTWLRVGWWIWWSDRSSWSLSDIPGMTASTNGMGSYLERCPGSLPPKMVKTLLPIHHGVFVRKLSTPVPSINCYEKTPWKTNMTGWKTNHLEFRRCNCISY